MNKTKLKVMQKSLYHLLIASLAISVLLVVSLNANASEEDAKKILKNMSDFLSTQKSLSFDYDASLEIVTKDNQKLALVSSGSFALKRPNQFHSTRAGGFADVEVFFDGKTLTLLGKNLNFYAQKEITANFDGLVEELRVKHNRPLPAADLLLTNAYGALMDGVVDVKDLGSGVINGIECDYFAFRKENIDWQIWIAHGKNPYPLRYSITSKLIKGGPQYTIQTRNWKMGNEVTTTDFTFKNTTNAKKIDLADIRETGDLPEHFKIGESK